MGSLTDLINKLYDILGENTKYTVYGKPPVNVALSYPCIIISLDNNHTRRANDDIYIKSRKYTLTVITKDIFDDTYDLLENALKYCRFENRFISENLYHYKLILYF